MKNNKKKYIRIFSFYIIFMVLATIISNVASEFVKVTVTVQKTTSKSINHSIETEGTVVSDSKKLITVPEDLLIENVHIEKGQTVTSEDILFSIDLDSLQKQIEKYENLLKTSQTLASTTLKRAQDDYNNAVNDGEISVTSALQVYNNAMNDYENYRVSENCDENQLSSLKQSLDSAKETYDSTVKNRDQSVKETKRALEDAQNNTEYKNIDEYNSKINELKTIKNNKCNVYSSNTGTVEEIFIKNGERTSSASAITLALDSDEKSVIIDVDKSMQNYFDKKDSVSVSGYNSNNEYQTYENQQIYKIYSVLKSADADSGTTEDSDYIKVEIMLKDCDFSIGSTVKIKVQNKSEKSDYCVPINAVMQDGDDYFVYVVSKKNGLLGEEVVAKRVDIDIADKDSQYASIKNGEVLYDEDIICETDKIIEDGTKIKVSNENE